MTPRQKLAALRRLRDLIVARALWRWQAEGWATRPHLEYPPKTDADKYGWVDFDDNLVHLNPHPVDSGQPVAKTMLHEVAGHILFDVDGGTANEDFCDAIEETLWPLLTPKQQKLLANLVGPIEAVDP